MPDAAVAIDRLQALEVALDLPAQIALDHQPARADRMDNRIDLLDAQIFRPDIGVDIGRLENLFRGARADAVNEGERSFDAFIAGDIYSKESWHNGSRFGFSPGAVCGARSCR